MTTTGIQGVDHTLSGSTWTTTIRCLKRGPVTLQATDTTPARTEPCAGRLELTTPASEAVHPPWVETHAVQRVRFEGAVPDITGPVGLERRVGAWMSPALSASDRLRVDRALDGPVPTHPGQLYVVDPTGPLPITLRDPHDGQPALLAGALGAFAMVLVGGVWAYRRAKRIVDREDRDRYVREEFL